MTRSLADFDTRATSLKGTADAGRQEAIKDLVVRSGGLAGLTGATEAGMQAAGILGDVGEITSAASEDLTGGEATTADLGGEVVEIRDAPGGQIVRLNPGAEPPAAAAPVQVGENEYFIPSDQRIGEASRPVRSRRAAIAADSGAIGDFTHTLRDVGESARGAGRRAEETLGHVSEAASSSVPMMEELAGAAGSGRELLDQYGETQEHMQEAIDDVAAGARATGEGVKDIGAAVRGAGDFFKSDTFKNVAVVGGLGVAGLGLAYLAWKALDSDEDEREPVAA